MTDEGPGVPPDLGARIFERTISGRNSTGIGLAVARDLAEADGGRLELLQQQPAVFALFLSRVPAPARSRNARCADSSEVRPAQTQDCISRNRARRRGPMPLGLGEAEGGPVTGRPRCLNAVPLPPAPPEPAPAPPHLDRLWQAAP